LTSFLDLHRDLERRVARLEDLILKRGEQLDEVVALIIRLGDLD